MVQDNTSTSHKSPKTVIPTKYDVLCGRGRTCFEFEGNKRFRCVIASNINRYANAGNRKAKTVVVKSIIRQIMESGGRFLKKDPDTGAWYDGGMQIAKQKTGHSLRDACAPDKVKCMTAMHKALQEEKKKQGTQSQGTKRRQKKSSNKKNNNDSSSSSSSSSEKDVSQNVVESSSNPPTSDSRRSRHMTRCTTPTATIVSPLPSTEKPTKALESMPTATRGGLWKTMDTTAKPTGSIAPSESTSPAAQTMDLCDLPPSAAPLALYPPLLPRSNAQAASATPIVTCSNAPDTSKPRLGISLQLVPRLRSAATTTTTNATNSYQPIMENSGCETATLPTAIPSTCVSSSTGWRTHEIISDGEETDSSTTTTTTTTGLGSVSPVSVPSDSFYHHRPPATAAAAVDPYHNNSNNEAAHGNHWARNVIGPMHHASMTPTTTTSAATDHTMSTMMMMCDPLLELDNCSPLPIMDEKTSAFYDGERLYRLFLQDCQMLAH